jgi:hypothetical protein
VRDGRDAAPAGAAWQGFATAGQCRPAPAAAIAIALAGALAAG